MEGSFTNGPEQVAESKETLEILMTNEPKNEPKDFAVTCASVDIFLGERVQRVSICHKTSRSEG
jgi:hypothetical protein